MAHVLPGETGRRHTPEAFSPSRWDAISKEAGIVRGLDQWMRRLSSFSDRQERSAKDLEEQGEISEGRAKAKRSEAAAGRDLRQFIEQLESDTKAPIGFKPWVEFCSWAKRLLGTYVGGEPDCLNRSNNLFGRSRIC